MGEIFAEGQVVFVDLDNWACFFSKLPVTLSRSTFVHGFYGGGNLTHHTIVHAAHMYMRHIRGIHCTHGSAQAIQT